MKLEFHYILIVLLAFLNNGGFSQNQLKIAGGHFKISGDIEMVLKDAKLVNNGTFTATNGTVHLKGTANQNQSSIEGSNESTFYNLTINKTSNDAALGQNITIQNVITLSNGNLELNNSNVILNGFFTSAIGHYLKTSGTGSLSRTITSGSTISFPVGNGTYTPIIIKNDGTADVFSVRCAPEVLENGTSGNAFTSNVVNRTWHVSEAIVGGSDLTLTVYWHGTDELTGFDRTQCSLLNYEFDEWLGTFPTAAMGINPYSISRAGITSLSQFAVGSTSALPVELLSFRAFAKEKNVQLEWQTANEINNYHFEIEHSETGHFFNKIGEIPAVEIIEPVNLYDFLHKNPVEGNNYYRLKQVDYDGQFAYSNIEVVNFSNSDKEQNLAIFYPNPVSSHLILELPPGGQFFVQLIDELGRIILEKENPDSLNVSQLSAGVYFLKIVNIENGQQQLESIIISRK